MPDQPFSFKQGPRFPGCTKPPQCRAREKGRTQLPYDPAPGPPGRDSRHLVGLEAPLAICWEGVMETNRDPLRRPAFLRGRREAPSACEEDR